VRRRTSGGLTAPQRSSSQMGPADCPQARLAGADGKTSSSHTLTGRIREDSMNQGTHPEELPAEVLADVASVAGAQVTLLSRLPGGLNGGAMRVQLAGRADAVLKAVPRAHPGHLDETLRARRVAGHMRRRGYPAPAWLGAGATATHVRHLTDFADAAPVPELTPSIVGQLMEIIELQAGQASEPCDHWSYAWRVATGQEPAVAGLDFSETPGQSLLRQSVARLPGYSSAVSALAGRLRLACAGVPPPREAPDMVHADLIRAMSWSVTERWWRPWTSGTQAAARGRLTSPPSSGTPSPIRWAVPEGGCGRESSPWPAGRGRRCSQRHRSSCSSSGPSVSGATMPLQGWSSAAIAPSTS